METNQYNVAGQEIKCVRAEIHCDKCGEFWTIPEGNKESFAQSHVENGPCEWSDIGVW